MLRIIRIDRKFVILMFISLITNYVKFSETAINDRTDQSLKTQRQNATTSDGQYHLNHDDERNFEPHKCGRNTTKCSELQHPCIKCSFEKDCTYGEMTTVTCEPKSQVQCIGDGENENSKRSFSRNFMCRYCFLTELWEHDCKQSTASCTSAASIYRTNCTVKPHILCLGNRQFPKNVRCNWTRGSKYFTALVLSVTLGGFGVDRFYLGHWQEGIGKLFSFGGLGVWVIVDAILISIGYLGTSDGSLLL